MTQGDSPQSVPTDPASAVPRSSSNATVEGLAACIHCSYSLDGLPASGNCPECGHPVADSLKGIFLQYASPDFIRTIRGGHSLILNGILLQIVFMLVSVAVGIAAGAGAVGGGSGLHMLMLGGNTVCAIIIFLGYLKATEVDPGFAGTDKPTGARNVVRIAAIAQIALSLPAIALELISGATIDPGVLTILKGGISLLSMVAWAVQFFAMMRYTRWLGLRVPDAWIVKRTKTYMWLLPVLMTVGILLFGLGPLIALVLYWNLLDRMRKHLKAIEKTGVPAVLKGMAGLGSAGPVVTPGKIGAA